LKGGKVQPQNSIFDPILLVLIVVPLVLLATILPSIRVLAENERGVIFRLGRALPTAKGPGIVFIIPFVDRLFVVKIAPQHLEIPIRQNLTAYVTIQIFDPHRYVMNIKDVKDVIRHFVLSNLTGDPRECEEDIFYKLKENLEEYGVRVLNFKLTPITTRCELH